MSPHEARIRALDASWLAAAARRDLDGMLAIYAEDARELLPGLAPLVGRDAIRAFYADVLAEFPWLEYDFVQEAILVADSGDLAIASGTYRFRPDTRTPELRQTGKFVAVWRRIGEDWRLAINISNEDGVGGLT